MQYWQETTYVDESNYDQNTRTIPDNHWTIMYSDVLMNLKKAHEVIANTDYSLPADQAVKPNKLAVIEIAEVYAWSNLVETYGNVPYSEALDINNTLPVYDDAATIYKDLLTRLDKAIAALDVSKGSFSASNDLIYGGDVASWIKFGNTLRLRMAANIAAVPGLQALSKTTVKAALLPANGGIFTSNADNAEYKYSGAAPNNHPDNNELILSGRDDYVAAVTFTDVLNNLQDPRRAAYFDPNINSTIGTVTSVSGSTIQYTPSSTATAAPQAGDMVFIADGTLTPQEVGTVASVGTNQITIKYTVQMPAVGDDLLFGIYKGGQIGQKSPFIDYSDPARALTVGSRPGTILSYVEAQFLLAELAARDQAGYGLPHDAAYYYTEGIKASFAEWGAPGATAYLSNPAVDYATATGTKSWQEVIGTQEWIALYDRTFAPYLSVRRLDYPVLAQPARAESGFPVRYTYPINEQNLNNDNREAAASAIGGDVTETQLFWDVNAPNWGW